MISIFQQHAVARAFRVLDCVQSVVGWGDIVLLISISPTLSLFIDCRFHSSKGDYAIRFALEPQALTSMTDRGVDMYGIGEGERIKLQLKDKDIGMGK